MGGDRDRDTTDETEAGLDRHHLPNLEFVFRSEDKAYYKNPTTKALNEYLGDVQFSIMDREKHLQLNMESRLLLYFPAALAGVRLAAQLDCILSLAKVAIEYGWVSICVVTELTDSLT